MTLAQITLDLSKLSEGVVLGAMGIVACVVLLVPLALKLAGLSGQQIADVLSLTMQFFINLIGEFRAQNKDK